MIESQKCSICGRERTLGQLEHLMDAYDYTPMQLINGHLLGWYSGDDGEVCPEDMTLSMMRQ